MAEHLPVLENQPAPREQQSRPVGLGSLVRTDLLGRWVWVLLYTAVLTSLSALRYQTWLATGWDLGLYGQGLWAIWHHGLLGVSSVTGLPIVAQSGGFILWGLAPWYHLGGVGFLLVLQSFCLGLGYYFIYRLGGDLEMSPPTRHVLGLVYLANPVLWAANLDDFHPVVIGVPLLFAAVHFALNRRWGAYALVLTGALVSGDVAAMALAVIGLGIALAVSPGRRDLVAAGLLTAFGAAAWLALSTDVIIPHWTHQSYWLPYYRGFGPTAEAAVGALARQPWLLFGWLEALRPWEYLIWVGGPVGSFWLFRGRLRDLSWLVGPLLIVEYNGLSGNPGQTSPFDQYSLALIPALFLTALFVGRRVTWRSGWIFRWRGLIPVAFLLVTLVHLHETTWRNAPPNALNLNAAAALVPTDRPVVAQNFIMPHFANRARLYDTNQLGTVALSRGTVVVTDTAYSTANTSPTLLAGWIARLTRTQKVLYQAGGVDVFRVVHPSVLNKGVTP